MDREIKYVWNRWKGELVESSNISGEKPFLKGPISWDWIVAASQLSGRALAIGLVLWYLAGLRKTHRQLVLSNERLVPLGIDRYTKARALKTLTEAGLIFVEQTKGRSPRVTIVV